MSYTKGVKAVAGQTHARRPVGEQQKRGEKKKRRSRSGCTVRQNTQEFTVGLIKQIKKQSKISR